MRLFKIAVVAVALGCLGAATVAPVPNLIDNGTLARRDPSGRGAAGFTTTGAVDYRYLGDPRRDASTWGFALDSTRPAGEVTCVVGGLDARAGRWFRFSVRGLPQANFASADLHLRVAFFGQAGRVSYDAKSKPLSPLIEQARRDLTVNGVRHQHGAEVWQTYAVDFVLPFPQVDQLRLSVGFTGGSATAGRDAAFLVDEVSLVRIPEPPGVPGPATRPAAVTPTAALLPLGGRWFYLPRDGESAPPKRFDAANVDRLLYHDAVYSAPFAGNATAWLRAGDKDLSGNLVRADRLIADNVTIEFATDTLIVHSHGVPNHPTGRFPEQGFGNPSYITEQAETFYLPVNPRVNPSHRFTDANNANRALHMGPIGVAVNGVVFFNPFDMGSQDATNMMDRCCGHPNQDGLYHYHKYPICLNSPWSDAGTGHSPLIGFAFDGFPLYGPYESADVMAKDLTGPNKLNDFNLHYDAERGWHYHVTPGQFPYLIGGFWGVEDSRNMHRPGGRRGGMGPPPGGPDGGDRPFPPPGM
jgi:hypothetical protein